MGRKRQFKRQQVACTAMAVFWDKGFAETSLHDLELATGVKKSGLYPSFEERPTSISLRFVIAWPTEAPPRKRFYRRINLHHPAAHAGDVVLSQESTEVLLESFATPDLAPRELQVLALIAEGHANKEIAARLDITRATVQVHARNIFMKLEGAGRTEAAMVALRRGMLPFQGFTASRDRGTRARGSQRSRGIERERHARNAGTGPVAPPEDSHSGAPSLLSGS